MAITATQTNGIDRIQLATGRHFDDAGTTAAAVVVGFKARLIVVENETDRINFTWREGMTSDYCVKSAAAGTRTLETSGGITINTAEDGFGFAVITDKQYRWEAYS